MRCLRRETSRFAGGSSGWATRSSGRPRPGGRETFAHGAYLLGNTDSLIYATGIANILVRDPMTMAVAAKTLAELAPDRFILDIGVSHRSLVEDLHGHKYLNRLCCGERHEREVRGGRRRVAEIHPM
jgi:alkanesulfonate monooxygenase SsuD/methylene tetrahydromethanopterin reductase-like flavin-dependent oxidoreductase (luciferase family)